MVTTDEPWFCYANHSLTMVFVVQTVVIQMVINTLKTCLQQFYYDKTIVNFSKGKKLIWKHDHWPFRRNTIGTYRPTQHMAKNHRHTLFTACWSCCVLFLYFFLPLYFLVLFIFCCILFMPGDFSLSLMKGKVSANLTAVHKFDHWMAKKF